MLRADVVVAERPRLIDGLRKPCVRRVAEGGCTGSSVSVTFPNAVAAISRTTSKSIPIAASAVLSSTTPTCGSSWSGAHDRATRGCAPRRSRDPQAPRRPRDRNSWRYRRGSVLAFRLGRRLLLCGPGAGGRFLHRGRWLGRDRGLVASTLDRANDSTVLPDRVVGRPEGV